MAKGRIRVALVTGANRGIGFEVSRQLARKGLRVLMTARDPAKGLQAHKALAREGGDVLFRPLDVARRASVAALARYVEREHGTIDVLVNNAGIALDRFSTSVLDEEEAIFRKTLDTNFFGALRVSQALVPLMQASGYGRVVNISSGMGQLEDMQDGSPAYRTSKSALNALTRMLASAAANDNVLVNSMCPGWVRTDMGGPEAGRSVEKGAETAVWLAQLPDSGPSGGFFRDKKRIPW